MLPIATVQGVKDGISTGMIVDLSEYLKKIEGVSKEEHEKLEAVVSTKLDAEPIHKHHIEDVKQLQSALDGKYDKSEKYSYNVILSDSEKIPFLEAPKVLSMEIANKFEVEGYKFYVDDSSGDLMIVFNNVLIGSYLKTSGKWTLSGLETGAPVNHTHTTIDNNLTVNGAITTNELIINGACIQTPWFMGNNEEINFTKYLNCETVGAYFYGTVSMDSDLIVRNENVMAKINTVENNIKTLNATTEELQAKITQMEAVLQNHYQALILLLEKHDMVDTNTSDGSNITAGNA